MAAQKPWAVFVYMVADDEIGSPAKVLDDVAEGELDLMFGAVDRNRVHLAVQVDFRNKPKVWRYLNRRPEGSLPESSAANPQTLERFFEWAYGACPAERHLVLFWGHAFGTAGLFPDSRPGIADSQDLLSIGELRGVLNSVSRQFGDHAVDVLLFKNCCSGNLETAYELSDIAEVMIASQDRMPARGWPYADLLRTLAGPDAAKSPNEQIGRKLVQQLATYYADTLPQRDVPISLLRLADARRLRTPMRRLVEALLELKRAGENRWEIGGRSALRRAASFGDPAQPDVVNVCRYLRDPRSPLNRELSEAALAVERVVTRRVIGSHYSKTSAYNGAGIFHVNNDTMARGQSIIASAIDFAEYTTLAFCKDTNWNQVAIDLDQSPTMAQQSEALASRR